MERTHTINLSLVDQRDRVFLGSGNYGKVFKVMFAGDMIAMKVVEKRHNVGPIIQEIKTLQVARSPLIVTYYGVADDRENFYIFMKYMPDNLESNLLKYDKTLFERYSIIIDIIKGLDFLHSFQPPICHRDLKPGNVLLSKNGRAKLCDFGFSRVVDDSFTNEGKGSPFFMAPEVIAEAQVPHDQVTKCDIYSLGVLMATLISKKELKDLYDLKIQRSVPIFFEAIRKGRRVNINNIPSDQIRGLIRDCLAQDYRVRPTSSEVFDRFTQILIDLIPSGPLRSIWSSFEQFATKKPVDHVINELFRQVPLELLSALGTSVEESNFRNSLRHLLADVSDEVSLERWISFSKAFPLSNIESGLEFYDRLLNALDCAVFHGIDVDPNAHGSNHIRAYFVHYSSVMDHFVFEKFVDHQLRREKVSPDISEWWVIARQTAKSQNTPFLVPSKTYSLLYPLSISYQKEFPEEDVVHQEENYRGYLDEGFEDHDDDMDYMSFD